MRGLAHPLRTGPKPPSGGYVRFGVIEDHPIPWETYRYGMIVERPTDSLGHGLVVGATGSGKTVATYPVMWYPTLGEGWGCLMVDFKASAKTRAAMRALADANGKTLNAIYVGTNPDPESPTMFYDPFDWDGTPDEKASMLLSCLDLPEEGNGSHYSALATTWLRFLFRLLTIPGAREPGESQMGFLIRCCSISQANAVYQDIRRRDPRLADTLHHPGPYKDSDLSGLKSRIEGLAEPIALNLQPPSEHDRTRQTFDPMTLASAGGIGYISISSANESVLRGVGSLILRHLTAIMQVRMRQTSHRATRPMVIVVDEAATLKDKAVVIEDMLRQAREARMWIWLATQQLSAWPQSCQDAIMGNTHTIIALRADDITTATTLSDALGPGVELVSRRDATVDGGFLGDNSAFGRGDRQEIHTDIPLLAPASFQSIPSHHACIWFRDIPGLDLGSGNRKRRVPATPRQWTKAKRIHGLWEHNYAYDSPIIRIVVPKDMLHATENHHEDTSAGATSAWPPPQASLTPATAHAPIDGSALPELPPVRETIRWEHAAQGPAPMTARTPDPVKMTAPPPPPPREETGEESARARPTIIFDTPSPMPDPDWEEPTPEPEPVDQAPPTPPAWGTGPLGVVIVDDD